MPVTATTTALRRDREFLAIGINSGETVVYGKFAGTEITIDGQDLLIVSAGDVLATVGDAPQS